MLHILICDNDSNQSNRNVVLVNEYSNNCQEEFLIRTVDSYEEMRAYLDDYGDIVDVIITEAFINQIDGIDIIDEIERRLPNIKVIFVSRHPQLVFRSFKVRHAGFVPIPIDKNIMFLILDRILEEVTVSQRKYISLTKKGLITRICLDDIIYLGSNLHNLHIQTRSELFSYKEKLESVKNQLDYRFLQCHKSFIINMSFAVSKSDTAFTLTNGETIPISSSRQKDSRESFENFLVQFKL